jgi:hypothetical protein
VRERESEREKQREGKKREKPRDKYIYIHRQRDIRRGKREREGER